MESKDGREGRGSSIENSKRSSPLGRGGIRRESPLVGVASGGGQEDHFEGKFQKKFWCFIRRNRYLDLEQDPPGGLAPDHAIAYVHPGGSIPLSNKLAKLLFKTSQSVTVFREEDGPKNAQKSMHLGQFQKKIPVPGGPLSVIFWRPSLRESEAKNHFASPKKAN